MKIAADRARDIAIDLGIRVVVIALVWLIVRATV
jgi:hypothetical protein